MEHDRTSFRGTIISHAATVGLTLLAAGLLFGLGSERSRRQHLVAALEAERRAASIPVVAVASPPAADAPEPPASAPAGPPADEVLQALDPDERNNVVVYASVNKSVVNVTTEAASQGFFGEETSTGTGSGFVTDKAGHILTNFHVVQGADTVRATLYDGSTHPAEVVGADASNDVALLRIDVPADKLVPVVFGDSSKLLVGQKIMAIGNPFGLERTLTTGIVSSLDRSLRAKNGRMIRGIIQTDAAINPGNSGGPLLNTKGQVIGMNTAIISSVGQSAGVSFAVPINAIERILKPLIEEGHVVRADLGITRFYATDEGLLVLALAEGGPAERAGIRPIQVRLERVGPGFMRRSLDPDTADLIVAVDHKRVKTLDELLTEVEKHHPGQDARITVIRDGKPMDVVVRLGKS